MKVKMLISAGESNDATTYYINLIKKGLQSVLGEEIETIHSVSESSKEDILVVITLRTYFKVIKRNWKQKVIFWFQGLEPEELALANVKTFRQFIRLKYFSVLEWLALHKCKLLFFVSDAMRSHFRKKHHYRKQNYVVMPCFNMELKQEAFRMPGKYETPSFVYAGGILDWQCIRETLSLFKEIKQILPDATLTLLTRDRQNAQQLVDEAELGNVTIKFCPLDELPVEMAKYKYGFLLRRDNIINNVATPTKFNTYLALGLIPIISDVIQGFKSILKEMRTYVTVDSLDDFSLTLQRINSMENAKLSAEDVLKDFSRIFEEYYNSEKYKQKIGKAFTAHLK